VEGAEGRSELLWRSYRDVRLGNRSFDPDNQAPSLGDPLAAGRHRLDPRFLKPKILHSIRRRNSAQSLLA
jgi:hypothetical protein